MINKTIIKEAKKRIVNHTDSLDEGVRDRGISYNLYEIILKMENKNVSFSFLLKKSICNFFNRNKLSKLILQKTDGRIGYRREWIFLSEEYVRVLIEAGLGIKNTQNAWETIMFDGSIFDAIYRPNKYKVSKLKFHYLRMQNE